jgi:hypothetical protein
MLAAMVLIVDASFANSRPAVGTDHGSTVLISKLFGRS